MSNIKRLQEYISEEGILRAHVTAGKDLLQGGWVPYISEEIAAELLKSLKHIKKEYWMDTTYNIKNRFWSDFWDSKFGAPFFYAYAYVGMYARVLWRKIFS